MTTRLHVQTRAEEAAYQAYKLACDETRLAITAARHSTGIQWTEALRTAEVKREAAYQAYLAAGRA